MRLSRRAQLWLVSLVLFFSPAALYWQTTWMEYGFRDDYSVLRESREEPGKEVQFCGSQARPVYGWLLQETFRQMDRIQDMSWSRLGGSFTLGLMAAGACLILVLLHGWKLTTSACVGALLVLVPSGQMVASWSILWPYEMSAVLATAAYVLAETGFRLPGEAGTKRILHAVAAVLVLLTGIWMFQPNGLFYLVFIAVTIAGWMKTSGPFPAKRILQHLALLAGTMLLAYVLIRVAFAQGWLPVSKRVAFEQDYAGKLLWYAENALPNALALLVINDFMGRTAPWYALAVGTTTALLAVGCVLAFKRRGVRPGLVWLLTVVVLLGAAYGINMIASERWASYRTIYPVVGVILIFGAVSMEWLGEAFLPLKRLRVYLGAVLILAAAWLARTQAYELMAVPQNKELRLVEREFAKLDLAKDQKVYVITPTPEIAPARLLYTDELGSLSTDSDWVPKEIMKLLKREKHPELPPCRSLDHMVSGALPPPPGLYDVVIDLRGLREMPDRR